MKYFFKSSRQCDNCPQLLVSTTSAMRAMALAAKYFNNNGFKGEPIKLAV